MALTNSLLKSMGIEGDQRDQIMAAHQETLESIKAERDGLRDIAAKVPDLERQIEAMQETASENSDLKARCDELEEANKKLSSDCEALGADVEKAREEHDSYVQRVEAEKADAEKLALYKALLRDIGLDEKRVELAADTKAAKGLESLMVVDGALDGYEELRSAEAEFWAEFIPQPQGVKGQDVPTPPKHEPGSPGVGEANERAVQIARERHEKLYGTADKKEQ